MLRLGLRLVLILALLSLAAPVAAQQTRAGAVLLKADRVRRSGTTVVAQGNVTAQVGRVRLDCQQLRYDSRSGVIKARNECVFHWGDNFAAAASLTYDTRKQVATMTQVAGRGTDLAEGGKGVESPVFFWARKVRWTPEKVQLDHAIITTCDRVPGDWDYSMESQRVEIYPRTKLVASNTSFTIHGHKLYTLPTLIIPLSRNSRAAQTYFPSPGYSSIDGAFLRNRFNYFFDQRNYGTLRLDIYQKSGIGIGVNHFFSLGNRGGGNISFYRQNGSQSSRDRFEFNTNASYRFDRYTTLGVSYNANHYELPGFISPSNQSGAVTLSRYAPGSALQISSNFASSGSNDNSSYRFYYNVDLNDRWSGLLSAQLSRSSTSFTSTHRFHYLGSLRRRGKLFNADLSYESTGGQNTFFLNRKPELDLQSKQFDLGPVPFTAAASFGELEEGPSLYRTERYQFDLQVPDQIISTDMGNFHAGAGVRQSLYGNGDAQYVLAARAGWLRNFGHVAVARIDYNWQQPGGYTPFQHDLAFNYQTLTGGLEVYDSNLCSLSATAGYDLLYHVPHNVIPRLDLHPCGAFHLTTAAEFSPSDGLWRDVDTGITVQLTPGISVTHWSVYDLLNSRLTYQNFAINYQDHDWIASLAYRGVQNEVFFQLSLKAFPIRPVEIGPNPDQPVLPANLTNPFTR